MGKYININLDNLRSAKRALSDYSIERKKYVRELKSTVEDVSKAWKGDDNSAFLLRWNAMSAPDGIFTVTEENIKAYKSIISSAYSAYKKAQSESVEQASKINDW